MREQSVQRKAPAGSHFPKEAVTRRCKSAKEGGNSALHTLSRSRASRPPTFKHRIATTLQADVWKNLETEIVKAGGVIPSLRGLRMTPCSRLQNDFALGCERGRKKKHRHLGLESSAPVQTLEGGAGLVTWSVEAPRFHLTIARKETPDVKSFRKWHFLWARRYARPPPCPVSQSKMHAETPDKPIQQA